MVARSVQLLGKRWVKPGQAEGRYQRSGQSWIDSLRIFCQGGQGGNGLPDFGGRGGNGGSVVIEAAENRKRDKRLKGGGGQESTDSAESLYRLFTETFKSDPKKQRVKADRGDDSSKYKIVGTSGEDKVLRVPTGVTVSDEKNCPMAQLDQPGDRVMVALGGSGGYKETGYLGMAGQKRYVRIDYKLIADFGLVGFPNAGKSTLLHAISRARPKIASYPFTTIKPNLGELAYEDTRTIKMADLPGLIEGAHHNLGMGHSFLKHVERTSMLVFVVDVNGFQLNPESPKRNAFETIALLNRELELYNPDLLTKPAVCLVNKMDTEGSHEAFVSIKKAIRDSREDPSAHLENLDDAQRPEKSLEFVDVLPMSAKFSPNSVKIVKSKLRSILDEISDPESSESLAEEANRRLDLMINDAAPKLT